MGITHPPLCTARVDDAALWEIDENLARAELSAAERAQAHSRRRQLMVELGLAQPAGRGGDRRSTEKSSVDSYAAETAAALGVTKRTVEQELSRGDNITPAVLAQVAGTALDKGVVLDELARTPALRKGRARPGEMPRHR